MIVIMITIIISGARLLGGQRVLEAGGAGHKFRLRRCLSIYMSISLSLSLYIYIYIHMYLSLSLYIYIYVCIYT